MTSPTINLPTTGSDPKTTTLQSLHSEVNNALELVYQSGIDMALATSGYGSIAEGLAATTEGGVFAVASTNPLGILDFYQVVDSQAVFLGTSHLDDTGVSSGPYKWKNALEIARSPASAQAFNSQVGGTNVYPQSVTASSDGSTLFVARSATGAGVTSSDYIITAYDIQDFSNPIELTSFRINTGASREYLIYKEIGASVYLYAGTNNNPARFDITTLPVTGTTLAPSTIFTGVNNYNHVAHDGNIWWVPTGLTDNTSGKRTRADVVTWSDDFSTRLGSSILPRTLSSAFVDPILSSFIKTQSVCFHEGALHYGIGGLYLTASPTDTDSVLQGYAKFNPTTQKVETFVVDPTLAIDAFAEMFGRPVADVSVVENEGIVSLGGKVYSLMVSSADDTVALTGGLHLVEMNSSDSSAVDFSTFARLPSTSGFDPESATYYGWSPDQDGEFKHPLTGSVLSSVQDLADAMFECHMSSVRVYTTGLTVPITDPNGNNVASGSFVNMYHNRTFGCNIEIRGKQGSLRWWYTGGTMFEDTTETSSDGTLSLGVFGERSNNPALENSIGASVRPIGQIQSSAAEVAQYINTQRAGSVVQYRLNGDFSGEVHAELNRVTLRSASGGGVGTIAGSPEGVAAEPVGTWIFSTNGSIYYKATGTGNTGWVDPTTVVDVTRASMVTLISSGFIPTDGRTYMLGGLAYIGSTGATTITDLPGLVPAEGDWTPQHFGEINGTSDSATIQAMWDALTFGQSVLFPPDIDYGINATINAPISFKSVSAYGARFDVTVNGPAFDLNPSADPLNIEGTSQNYGYWQGGQFDSTLSSPTATCALKFLGIRQMTVKDTVIGSTTGKMIRGLWIGGLGGHDIENNRFIYTGTAVYCPFFASGVSGTITTSSFKNNNFLLDPATGQKAFFVDCGFNRWNIMGGFVNSTVASSFHFTNRNEASLLNLQGIGFEQAVAGGKFLFVEDTSGNELDNLNVDGCKFSGNPAGAAHIHMDLERVRRVVVRGTITEANQSSSNYSIQMDANCGSLEADSGCRLLDFPLNTGESLNINASVNRENIVFPDLKLPVPIALSGYNGNSFSTSTATLDMSTLVTGDRYPTHGVPPKGYTISVQARDSDSAGTSARQVEFASAAGDSVTRRSIVDLDGVTNDRRVQQTLYVPADANGDIYLSIVASGTNTVDLWIYLLAIHN